MNVPARLAAPEPSWNHTVDIVVVGSGVAGLTAALGAAQVGRRVLVVTKGRLTEGSTCWAQGGVAAALGRGDSPERHLRDTLVAGAGLSDETVVRELVRQGPSAIEYLVRLGAVFDPGGDGRFAFGREGGHSRARILHAGGDATGREIQRTLEDAVRAAGVDVLERAFVLDLALGPHGQAAGITAGVLDGRGQVRSVGIIRSRAVVLASGGFGQLYSITSNPSVATGDGVALALRAGAEVTDLEFVQFHPTVLFRGGDAAGRQLLLSEAMRGEGGVLVDVAGERVMAGAHPLGDLAPRDVVALAISRRMAETDSGHVYLDVRGLGADTLPRRFPTIVAACRAAGIDPATEPIPVAPAAHYACGGVRADLSGRTSVPGLFAVGEVACTGVHGANRLASNSLLEGLVMGARSATVLSNGLPPPAEPQALDTPSGLVPATTRSDLAATMSGYAAVRRTRTGLTAARAALERIGGLERGRPSRAAWETTNLHAVATVLVRAAALREESRGCHHREDWPQPRCEWQRQIVTVLRHDGRLCLQPERDKGRAA